MGDDFPKYINSPQSDVFDKSSLLYGLANSRVKNAQGEARTAVVVEGYHDVIKTRQNGIFDTVAQMGTALTDKQLILLSQQGIKTVLLCLDNDQAGQSATRKLADTHLTSGLLSRLGVNLKIMALSGGKDADDVISRT
ncbi:toprim domain-containing protein, partial [Corallococcus exercitus]|uniref:toprim domain-containing protein n=1 Tax=Corallococcus exercitus TaxID=2316736 RepID=UPI000EA33794